MPNLSYRVYFEALTTIMPRIGYEARKQPNFLAMGC
jgi:hypothetical protein